MRRGAKPGGKVHVGSEAATGSSTIYRCGDRAAGHLSGPLPTAACLGSRLWQWRAAGGSESGELRTRRMLLPEASGTVMMQFPWSWRHPSLWVTWDSFQRWTMNCQRWSRLGR